MKKSLICALLGLSTVAAAADKLNVLIITGMNNHKWQPTTDVLKKACEDSGRFTVDVTLKPEEITAESISKYDALISNWNCFGKGNLRWGETSHP